MPDTLKLKFGTEDRVDAATYSAGTMYLSKLDSSTADLYFDMGGTRLKVKGFGDTLTTEQAIDMADQIALQVKGEGLNNNQVYDMIDDIWTQEDK